jgi:imidazolonepropionase-like amidohydrolase
MARTIFVNASIFDGTGAPLFPGEVAIEGNRIVAVAPGSDVLERGNADVVDCAGGTLLPGLIDPHAHLTWPSSVGRIINAMSLPPEEHLLVTAHNARVLLDSGFTSAYSAGALGPRFEVALRDEIDAGYLPGPRLRASSLENAPGDVVGVPASHHEAHARGPEGLRAFVRACAADRVDTIKFLLSSDDGFAPGGGKTLTYTVDEIRAAGEQARESGVWLAAHAQAADAVILGAQNGWRIIYHCSYADERALDALEARKDDIFVAPAPALLYTRIHEAAEFGITREVAERMGAVSGLERMQVLYPEMRRRGIRVLPGGDYGFPYNPIGRNARDFELFMDLFGFTAAEVLSAATFHGAALMGYEGELGLVRDGYLADLIVVDGDPLGDVRVLQDRNRITAIVKDGRFHKRATAREVAHANR